jgi:1,2-dihydroxy-3-keto-5-methylthiopentene dioxygenase
MKGEKDMAAILLRRTNERLTGEESVKKFLVEQGVLYEHWNINKIPEDLQEKFVLSNQEKAKILEVFAAEIKSLANRHGYKEWDIVTLSEATPNLAELFRNLSRFICIPRMKYAPLQQETGFLRSKGTITPDISI